MAKPRFPREQALLVAAELCRALKPWCDRLIVAGSLRRQKPTVGDVEILYIGRVETTSEEEVFTFVGLPYAEPKDRL